ncbi:MAG: histidinol dehydrogenase, partial [Actinomycetota bacterium]|nr:histidinol dehydrogenase [Actinomycetota bacterium]
MKFIELGPDATAAEIRALAPAPRDVEADVRAILDEVRTGGDAAVLRLTERFDRAELDPGELRVDPAELDAAIGVLEPDVLQGLRTAIANVRAVVEAQLREPVVVELPEGQRVEVAELPVRRAAIYVPAGRAPLASSLVMGVVTARAAGAEEIAVCAPPGPEGRAHPVILAACTLCGVAEVYRMGGAQAIAALAYGTESVPAVDVIAGPGNNFAQEAKRQVAGLVGIDGIEGPSELLVVADGRQDPELIALDLLAQGEHGDDGLLGFISPLPELLEGVRAAIERMAPARPSVAVAPLALVRARDTSAAVRLADRVAPEHLQLVGPEAEALAPTVRAAGCLFVGPAAATAFGDYVAGSNHLLPTGGAARFQSALSAATF